jgi:hypothetical protein
MSDRREHHYRLDLRSGKITDLDAPAAEQASRNEPPEVGFVPPCRSLLAVKQAPEPRLVGRSDATTQGGPE